MTVLSSPDKEVTYIGHYQILEQIGRGGMGIVYLALDTRLNRNVAIKCLRTELVEPQYRERFKREALLLAKLNHPNIVQIYDFLETTDQLGLVMELVEGQNLQQHLRLHAVPFGQRMAWLANIAQALAVAHDSGIIHRDLKAENILIGVRGEAKISDFGIAKSQEFNAALTEHAIGTYGAMSPEQAKGEAVDFRSDLFSFGILAYQMLCGAHPFGDTDNKLQLMQRIITGAPTPAHFCNPELPIEISDLLGQLLSKNPNNRPANTHWVAAQWERLRGVQLLQPSALDDTLAFPALLQSPALNSAVSDNKSAPARLFVFTRFRKRIMFISGSILLIATAAAYSLLLPQSPRYIAILQPVLTSSELNESQQKFIKGAVYDALMQSVLQLKGYYLIPRTEVESAPSNQTLEGMEALRKATAADELLTAQLQCTLNTCALTIARLTPDGKQQTSRLRVQDTKTADLLPDNAVTTTTLIQRSVGSLYATQLDNRLDKIDEQDYRNFLEVNQQYREQGATQPLLERLNTLSKNTKRLPELQKLYTNISLDLRRSTMKASYLADLQEFLDDNTTTEKNLEQLYNQYYLQIAQSDLEAANQTRAQIVQKNTSTYAVAMLNGGANMVQRDYQKAAEFYNQAFALRHTAAAAFNLSRAYWYSGNTGSAKKAAKEALNLSPNLQDALLLYGSASLADGDLANAVNTFNRIIEIQPTNIAALTQLGLCYMLLKEYDQAVAQFDQARRFAPDSPVLKLNEADTYDLMGDKEKAKTKYAELVAAKDFSSARTEELMPAAQAYAHLGQFMEALTILQRIEKNDPDNIETTYIAALVHTLANNKTSAILNVEETLKKGRHTLWFSFSWFDALCTESKFDELINTYGEPNRCARP